MKFCNICDNMYYIRIDGNDTEEGGEDGGEEESNSLVYYCRNCGNKESQIMDTICISDSRKKSKNNVTININEYTKLDPTLPRINNIPCPNSECVTNTKDIEKEVIYIRYDDTNLKFIYLCAHCNTTWKLNE